MTLERSGGIDREILQFMLSLGVKLPQARYLAAVLKDVVIPPEILRDNFLAALALVPTAEDGRTVAAIEGFEGAEIGIGQDIFQFAQWLLSPQGNNWTDDIISEFTGQPTDPRRLPGFEQFPLEMQQFLVNQFNRGEGVPDFDQSQTRVGRILAGAQSLDLVDPRTDPAFQDLTADERSLAIEQFRTAQGRQTRQRQEELDLRRLQFEADLPGGGATALREQRDFNAQRQSILSGTGTVDQKIEALFNLRDPSGRPPSIQDFIDTTNAVLDNLPPEERAAFGGDIDPFNLRTIEQEAAFVAERDIGEEERIQEQIRIDRGFRAFQDVGGRLSRAQFISEGEPAGRALSARGAFERALPADLSTNQERFLRGQFGTILGQFEARPKGTLTPFAESKAFEDFLGGFDFLKNFRQASRFQRGELPRQFRPPTRTLRF